MSLPFSTNPGDQLYKYTLQSLVGTGSFSEVWLARDQAIQRDIAVKLLDPAQSSVGELLKEAEVGNRTDHPNLVKMHYADVVNHNGNDVVVVAMDYLPAGSVLNQLCSGNFVPIGTAIGQIVGVLRGLEYLHEQNTFHNDIKPQNILVGANGEAKLTDYGISAVSPSGKKIQATGAYRLHTAPEVIQAQQIDPVTDIYQVGLTAFRLINGVGLIRHRLNAVGSAAFDQLIVTGKLVRPSDYQPFVPIALKRVINKAISSDPTKRYQSALEMRRALEKLRFHGFWICDANSDFIGEDAKHHYRFEIIPAQGSHLRFTAFKTNKDTNRETRIGRFSKTGLTKQETNKIREKFMRGVVEGLL